MALHFLQCSNITVPRHEASFTDLLLPLTLLSILAGFYLWGVCWINHQNKKWNVWRLVSFILGTTLLAVALNPSMVSYAHADFKGHMLQHLLLGMLAPIGLVMGAPVTLALKTLPHRFSKVLAGVLGCNVFHIIGHPYTTLLLNPGSMFILYMTPLYNTISNNHFLHHLLHLHFLLAGYLFTWSIVGPDPAPKRPGFQLRLTVLFISIAAHAYLSKIMYAYIFPKFSQHSEDEIRNGAKLMYYGGDLAELIIIFILFATWYKKRGKPKYSLHPSIF